MKKLTKTQLNNLIKTGAFTKSGKIHGGMIYGIQSAFSSATNGEKIHFMNSGGPRKPITTNAGMRAVADILSACGYKVIFGNDAPRGGMLGDYFKLSRKIKITLEQVESQVIEFLKD